MLKKLFYFLFKSLIDLFKVPPSFEDLIHLQKELMTVLIQRINIRIRYRLYSTQNKKLITNSMDFSLSLEKKNNYAEELKKIRNELHNNVEKFNKIVIKFNKDFDNEFGKLAVFSLPYNLSWNDLTLIDLNQHRTFVLIKQLSDFDTI
jgi:hypothetical protein